MEERPIAAVKRSRERFFDLGPDFQRKRIETLREFTDILQELVIKNDGWDGDEEAGGRGDKRFRDAGGHCAQAGGARIAETGKGINNAPDSPEQSDKRRDGTGGSEPRHALFDAANLFTGSKLHANGDGLKAFQFSSRLRVAGSHLAKKFAIARGIHGSERRAGGGNSLWIGDAFGGAEDADKLITLTAKASKETKLLEDHGPGDDGKDSEQYQNSANKPAGFSQDTAEISDENRCEQGNDATSLLEINFRHFRNVA